jgi:phenylalanyl-tRNA synthetase alpha chain
MAASCSRSLCRRCCLRPERSLALLQAAPKGRTSTFQRGSSGQQLTATAYSHPRQFSTYSARLKASTPSIKVFDKDYPSDDYTNLPSSILSRLSPSPELPSTPSHPLRLLNEQIHRSLSKFDVIQAPSPIVTVEENFGQLGIAEDHPGRSPTDTYYLNRQTCLRTHTSAHEVQTFAKGKTRWILTADVFRRDEIDASHYPMFHQMEAACIFDVEEYAKGGKVEKECEEMESRLSSAQIEIQDNVDLKEAGGYQASHESDPAKYRAAQLSMRHLKATLNNLVLDLFADRHAADSKESTQDPLKVRWIAAEFPFTSPSFEIEVMFRGKWLEILGSGVVMEKTLKEAGVSNKVGWAFGLGLERIAMVLFQIPDIRLFWSRDNRFLSQFAASPASIPDKSNPFDAPQAGVSAAGGLFKLPVITFKPYSKFPPCYKDVSFWLPSRFHENNLYEIIRDVAGDLTEDVVQIDEFTHPKTQRKSKCYRINYRSMDR